MAQAAPTAGGVSYILVAKLHIWNRWGLFRHDRVDSSYLLANKLIQVWPIHIIYVIVLYMANVRYEGAPSGSDRRVAQVTN